MTHGFEGSQVGATPIEEGMRPKKRTKKAFDDAERHPSRCRTPPPPRCVWGPITQAREWTSFGTQGGPTSPPEWNITPGMLLGSIQGLWWPSSSSATIRMHPHAEGPMAQPSRSTPPAGRRRLAPLQCPRASSVYSRGTGAGLLCNQRRRSVRRGAAASLPAAACGGRDLRESACSALALMLMVTPTHTVP